MTCCVSTYVRSTQHSATVHMASGVPPAAQNVMFSFVRRGHPAASADMATPVTRTNHASSMQTKLGHLYANSATPMLETRLQPRKLRFVRRGPRKCATAATPRSVIPSTQWARSTYANFGHPCRRRNGNVQCEWCQGLSVKKCHIQVCIYFAILDMFSIY